MNVSRETLERFAHYESMIAKWNATINLIAPSTVSEFATRHIADCAQIVDRAGPAKGHWIDLGSGGGLPGIVVAILMEENDLRITLVESDQRKSAFLRSVIRELSLTNVSVLSERIEVMQPQDANHVSARALAPLSSLLPMIHKHMRSDGTAWLMKGRSWKKECDDARANWQFDLCSIPSTTDPEAAILKISGVLHA